MIPPEEIADLMKFIAEKSKDAKSPLSIRGLARQYKEDSGSSSSSNTLRHRIKKSRLKIHKMNEFDVDTKVKMIFALGAPVDDGFLKELKKMADVVVDDSKRIIQYKKKGGGMELNWNEALRSSPEEFSRKMLEFLEEKAKTVNSPMMDQPFLREFKSATGDQSSMITLSRRYARAKDSIYKSFKFNKNTKVKMLFISNAKITGDILNEPRKCARVDVDERGRITKYEAKDGSLHLKRIRGTSNAYKRLNFDRWHAICLKVITDDDDKDDEENYELIKLIRYVIERTKNVKAPLNITKLALDYKRVSGCLERLWCIYSRIRSFRQRIGGMDMFDTPTKVKCLFALSARISEDVRKKLQKDAVVELDGKQRIEKYEAQDGSLILKRKLGRDSKRRAETKDLEDSSGSEEEEDISDDEDSEEEEEEEENMRTSDKEEEERNERIRQSANGNDSEFAKSGIAKDKRKTESLYLPSGFSEDELSEDDNQSAMINERKKARISYSSSEESENDGERGDGGEEVHKRARIPYSSSGESEKKLSDEDESEKSMDLEMGNVAFGEEDNDYDPPSYNQYDEILSDSVRMEEERSHQDSSNSKTNEKNPVNITTSDSNISSSSSSSEENSGDESPEKKMPPPTLPEEIVDLMKFIAEKSKNVNSRMNITELARQFKKDSGSSLTVNGIVSRIRKYRLEIHEMNEFDVDTKMKMIFALGAPVDDGFLIELKKVADVEVDDRQRITDYKKKGGGLELVNENGKLLEFLEEKSKTVKTPMVDQSFLKEFKRATGDQSTLGSLTKRYACVKDKIYKSSKFNKNTKIKMMFISNAKITGGILNELQKDAIVELDEKQRMKKYKAKDGSLKLGGMCFDRWRAACQKVINGDDSEDNDDDDEEESVEDRRIKNEYIKLIRYVIERTKNVKAPLRVTKLARDFKKESGSLERWERLYDRMKTFRQRIGEMDLFDTPTKIRCLFALSATITADVLQELQKDAIVELDDNRRIKKYEAKNASLILKGEHGQAAKLRAETEDLEDSSDAEDEESEEEEEERNERIRQPANGNDSESAESQGQSGNEGLTDDEGEGEENDASMGHEPIDIDNYGDDFNDDLPDYHHYSDRNPEENELNENDNEADLSSMTPESIDDVYHGDDFEPMFSQQIEERIQAENSEQVPMEQDPQGLNETEDRVEDIDQIVAETTSDALIIVQIIEQIVESVDVESRAHQIQNRISEDHPKAKRARISYSSSAESEKKLSDEDESEKSMDFGEEDNDYDLPNYHQYEEMFHEEIIQKSVEERDEIGEERSEFASSTSETNEKNPVDITVSESNFEGNSGDESEKEESVKSKDLPPEAINVIDNGDDYEERIEEENSEQVPKEKEPHGPLEDQNAAPMTSQILEQAVESIEQKPEHLIENVQQERKRARMLDSVPEESINKLKRYCIELKEPKPENLIELPQEIRSEATSVRDILFLLKASLMAIESTKLIGLLKEIESIMEKLDNGSLLVTLDNINDPFELSFFPLIKYLAPKGPTKEETTSLYHFLVSLKTVTFQISNPTIHLLRRKLKTLIGELRVEDKRIPIHLIDIAMKTTIEMITSGSSN